VAPSKVPGTTQPRQDHRSAGAQNGQHFRLRSKGMSCTALRGPRRPLRRTPVETPVNLTKRQQELLREFEAAARAIPQPRFRRLLRSRFREFFEDLKE